MNLATAKRVDLTRGGRAVASTDAGNTRVSLSSGSVRLDVKPRDPGRRFQVDSGPFRFVVVGTSFRVIRSAKTVELWVFEGHVAVWRAEHMGPMVAGGEHWTGTLPAVPRAAGDLLSFGAISGQFANAALAQQHFGR